MSGKRLFSLFIAILLMLSSSTVVYDASPDETRYNNTVAAISAASISDDGVLTVTNMYEGIKGTTTKGEITTYIEKKILCLFWIRVNIGQPNNQWYDVVYDYMYICNHTFQLQSHGTYVF